MAAPLWVTPPGDLGTVVEGEFYQVQLDATNAASYKYLSGTLPIGIRVTQNGVLEGNPRNYDYIQGVPTEVAQDVTSKFVVRAVSSDGTVADRVFEMTVTGQDDPVIDTTPESNLGTYFDGDLVDVQLTATDPDPGDSLSWSLQSGELPAGVSISKLGKIYGYIEPFATIAGTPGFDINAFDIGEWDFRTKSENKNYEFTIAVTDGKTTDVKKYSLFAASRNLATADLDLVTADNVKGTATDKDLDQLLDASQTNLRNPALITQSTGLGRVDHNNWFNFQFVGKDFDGDTLDYYLDSGSLPPGLTLDQTSGWLTGAIPSISATEASYTFAIRVEKRNNSLYKSAAVNFTMTVVGNVQSTVTWPTSDLSISTGQLSELDVRAIISDGRPVQYELKSGSKNIQAGNFVVGETYTIVTSGNTDFTLIGSANNTVGTIFTATGVGSGSGTASLSTNRLPQGLKLNEDGYIVGRVSFETLMFDTGTTTFDFNDLVSNETTFENTYNFVARVFSTDGVIDTYKKFTINVSARNTKPYESLYAKALPVKAQRDIYDTLIQNSDDIPPEDVYRPSDYSFGVQTDLRFVVSAGLVAAPITDFIETMSKNFYNNTLRFGEFKTARALNADGTVKYEVVYVDIVDNMIGTDPTTGLPASPALRQDLRSDVTTWSNPLSVDQSPPDVSHSHYLVSQVNDYFAYPNSFENMRSRLKTGIGQQVLERTVLPDWMQDKQADGSIIGWKLAVPIVYCKPGTADKIKFRLEKRTGQDLKKISFEVDRFILDNNLSKYYNKTTGKFTVTQETSFDVSATVTVFDGDGTRFFAQVDTYAAKDEGDVYIKFTQKGVFDRPTLQIR